MLQVYISRIIANEIKMIAERGHQLESKISSTLAFPGMIMGFCQRSCIPLPVVVHETIDVVFNDKYIDRYCMTKASNFFSTLTPPAQQPFDKRDASHTWHMHEADQRAFMLMHGSMHQLQVQIGEPHIDHSLPSRYAFQ